MICEHKSSSINVSSVYLIKWTSFKVVQHIAVDKGIKEDCFESYIKPVEINQYNFTVIFPMTALKLYCNSQVSG